MNIPSLLIVISSLVDKGIIINVHRCDTTMMHNVTFINIRWRVYNHLFPASAEFLPIRLFGKNTRMILCNLTAWQIL